MNPDEELSEGLLRFCREAVEHLYSRSRTKGVKDPVVISHEQDLSVARATDSPRLADLRREAMRRGASPIEIQCGEREEVVRWLGFCPGAAKLVEDGPVDPAYPMTVVVCSPEGGTSVFDCSDPPA